MPINMNPKNRTSTAYIGTFNAADGLDMIQLDEVKTMVKGMNRMLREDGSHYQFRVVIRGRKPVVKNGASYDYHGNIKGGIGNASRVDAYIYRR